MKTTTTKLTITVNYDLNTLKKIYCHAQGIPKGEKVYKKDIAEWLGDLAESDVQGEEEYTPNLNSKR